MSLQKTDIMKVLCASLSADLLSPKWRNIVARSRDQNNVAGHCAIATEALYDLVGGSLSGHTPFVCSYYYDQTSHRFSWPVPVDQGGEKMTHWWIREPNGIDRGKGCVLDITARQYKIPFPYERGTATGFMSPTPPSKRARILIDRVVDKLGADNINEFRETQIQNYINAGGKLSVSKSMQRRRDELSRQRSLKRIKPFVFN